MFGALYRLGREAVHAHVGRPPRQARAAAAGVTRVTALAAGARATSTAAGVAGAAGGGGAGAAAAAGRDRAAALDTIGPLSESRGSLRAFMDAMLCPRSPAVSAPAALGAGSTTARVGKGWAPLRCHEGKCGACGVHNVSPLLDALILLAPAGDVSWNAYDYVETNGKRKLEQVRVGPLTPAAFKKHVLDGLFGRVLKTTGARQYRAGFAWHSFEVAWLAHAMAVDKDTFEPGCVWLGTDFAQNATIKLQDEVSGQYFTPVQVTIYNLVVFYHTVGLYTLNSVDP